MCGKPWTIEAVFTLSTAVWTWRRWTSRSGFGVALWCRSRFELDQTWNDSRNWVPKQPFHSIFLTVHLIFWSFSCISFWSIVTLYHLSQSAWRNITLRVSKIQYDHVIRGFAKISYRFRNFTIQSSGIGLYFTDIHLKLAVPIQCSLRLLGGFLFRRKSTELAKIYCIDIIV